MGIQFLREMNRRAGLYEVPLSHTDKVFFKRLMDYAKEYGVQSEKGYKIHLSLKEISIVLNWSFRNVQYNIERLEQAHCLIREDVGREMRGKKVTIIEYGFYKESEEIENAEI